MPRSTGSPSQGRRWGPTAPSAHTAAVRWRFLTLPVHKSRRKPTTNPTEPYFFKRFKIARAKRLQNSSTNAIPSVTRGVTARGAVPPPPFSEPAGLSAGRCPRRGPGKPHPATPAPTASSSPSARSGTAARSLSAPRPPRSARQRRGGGGPGPPPSGDPLRRRTGRGRRVRRGGRGRGPAAAAARPYLLRDGRVAAAAPGVAGAQHGRRRLGLRVPVEERGPLGAAAAAQRRHLGSKRWGEGGGGGSRVPAAGTPPAATRSGRGRGASADPGRLPAARATARHARLVTSPRIAAALAAPAPRRHRETP